MESCGERETAGCCGRMHTCRASSSWPPSRSHRPGPESDGLTRGRRGKLARPGLPLRPLFRECFAGVPLLRRHGTARTLPAPVEPWILLRDGRHGKIRKLARLARCARCWAHEKPRRLHLRHFGRMRIVLDARVALFATQNAVNTGCMFRGINRDAFAIARCHSRLAMAGQAALVLLERLWRLYLRSAVSVCRGAD